ncbi:hypothetical protein BpHYR1_026086 [Brachionus plicatilis]|uniref:Uncharacterized protein n=1 Tax=Brachionus plicatilis TaxID=10195 RepID=A0A3M7S643_BRAPC|nr:hypothetical protein BpHYR1_026086 [Brachionus plicatilis]
MDTKGYERIFSIKNRLIVNPWQAIDFLFFFKNIFVTFESSTPKVVNVCKIAQSVQDKCKISDIIQIHRFDNKITDHWDPFFFAFLDTRAEIFA